MQAEGESPEPWQLGQELGQELRGSRQWGQGHLRGSRGQGCLPGAGQGFG